MHIAVFTHHYEPEESTPQRRWSALIEGFTSAGHQVTVFAPPLHGPAATSERQEPASTTGISEVGRYGEAIYRTKFRDHDADLASRALDQLIVSVDSIRLAWKTLRRSRPDVLVSTAPSLPSAIAGMVAATLLRVPHVVEMRDAWPDLIRESNFLRGASLRRRLAARAIRFSVSQAQLKAAAVITTTETFANVLQNRGVKRVLTIRNSSWRKLRAFGSSGADDHVGLRVLYAGTTGRSQGIEYAILAAKKAQEAGTRIDLRIVGDGVYLDHLKQLATDVDLPVEFLGAVPFSDIPAHYEWADTLLVSLIDWPPFEWTVPSKLYEVFAVGKHVSAVLRGEAADLVNEFHAGHVVPPEDSDSLARLWQELAANRELLTVPTAAAEWVCTELAPGALSMRYLGLLHEVATQRRRRTRVASMRKN